MSRASEQVGMDRAGERGGAYILSIFLLTILTMLAIGAVTTAVTDLKVSDNYARSMRNFYAAEAGANHAVSMMQSDPTTGAIAPYPSGTPLATGTINMSTYSIWLWNRRINGNGTIDDFDNADTRQFRVEGSDGRGGIRKVEGIIEPARRAPNALKRAVFTCQQAILINGGEVEGDIYSKGDMNFVAKSVNVVNAECYGALTNTKDISGWAKVKGAIHNNTNKIKLGCKTASATIDKPANCTGTGAAANVSPCPAKDYCTAGGPDWDPDMLNYTTADIDKAAADPDATQHLAGWTSSTAIALTTGTQYVTGGNVAWTNNTITYTGNAVVVIDGTNNFICDACKIQGSGTGSNIVIITRAGDISGIL